MDGHRGLKNDKVNEQSAGDFRLVLSALEEDERRFTFVIHATSSTFSFSGLQPLDLLQRLGYRHYQGNCQFHGDRCLWRPMAVVHRRPFADTWQIQGAHEAFKRHAENLPRLFSAFKSLLDLIHLPKSGEIDLFPELRQVNPPIMEPPADALPDWVAREMPSTFQETRSALVSFYDEHEKLRRIGALLWQDGDELADAVATVFEDLGFSVQKTEPSATYDLLVDLEDRRLLVEVGGIAGPLRKKSNKIAQALSAAQDAGENDKVVLVLNLHRDKPLGERKDVELVTPDALKLVEGLQVPIIQTATLFDVWKQSLDDKELARQTVRSLADSPGGLFEIPG